MKAVKRKKGIKEFFRKIMVSLKQRPHTIPLLMMLATFLVYTLQLSLISSTTGVINKNPMGLCTFMEVLFSLLGMVTFLNAFPKRQQPKWVLVGLLYLLEGLCLGSDIIYFVKLNEGINATNADGTPVHDFVKNYFLFDARNLIVAHIILLGVSILLIALIPVLKKLFGLVDTSIDLGEDQNVGKIEMEDAE